MPFKTDEGFHYTFLIAVFVVLLITFPLISDFTRCGELNFISQGDIEIDYKSLLQNLNATNIMSHINFFASLGSRVPGYKGFYEAASYIKRCLNSYGLSNVRFENYSAVSPLCEDAFLTILSPENEPRNIRIYPLWPMGPIPTIVDDEAEIIDVGTGSLFEFNGKNVEGSYVLMDFNSLWNWRNALMLGAKGIFFVEPEDTTKLEAMFKFSNLPAIFPRFFILRDDGLYLRELVRNSAVPVRIRVKADMRWKSVVCPNIIAEIEGSDNTLKNEKIALVAYYDSWSIVPSLNPGADDSLSVSALLEISRVLAKNPPARTVSIIVFSGHFRCVEGARYWMENHWNELREYKYVFSLDLSSAGPDLGVFARGSLYSYETMIENVYLEIHHKFFLSYLPKIENQMGKSYRIVDAIQWSRPVAATIYENQPILLESDPFTAACYGGGVGFHTTNAIRRWQGTPLDTFSRINFENYLPQVEVILGLIYAISNDRVITRVNYPTKFGKDLGITTVTLSVAEYNVTTSWYQPFIDNRTLIVVYMTSAKITEIDSIKVSFETHMGQVSSMFTQTIGIGQIYPSGRGAKAIPPLFSWYIVKPDDNGIARIPGIKSFSVMLAEAFVIDENTGKVIYATDFGTYGAPPFPSSLAVPDKRIINIVAENPYKYIAVFPATTIILTNIVDPRSLSPPTSLQVLDASSHGSPIWYGAVQSWPDAAIFVPPKTAIEIIVQSKAETVAILVNASGKSLEGSGYLSLDNIVLKLTPFDVVRDFYMLVAYRLNTLKRFDIYNPTVALFEQKSLHYYTLLRELQANRQYSDAYSCATSAWSYFISLYHSVMSLNLDVTTSLLFIMSLIVPFSLLLAKLGGIRISLSNVKSLAIIIGILFLTIGLLWPLHPGFTLSSNAFMILIGVSAVVLCILMIIQSFRETSKIMSEIRESFSGKHIIDIGRVSYIFSTLSLSLEQMRKRKFRVGLIMFSLSAVVFSIVTFTSISNILVMYLRYETREAPYQGLLLRNVPWQPISYYSLENIKETFGGANIIAVRTWLYPPNQEYAFSPKRKTFIRGFIGMSYEEANITGIDKFIINGSWFTKRDLYAVILPKSLVDSLFEETGEIILPNSTISIWGVNFLVRGIIDDKKIGEIVDLDGEPLSPVDYLAATQPGQTKLPHLDFRFVVILPVQLTINVFQASIMSIAIKLDGIERITEIAMDLSLRLNTAVYAALKEKIFVFLPRGWLSAQGITYLSVPLVIAAFSILNLMIGAVYERKREISIFTSVGLSPLHISLLFIMEAILYAVCGGAIGYIAGIAGIRLAYGTKIFSQDFYPNYVSVAPIIAVLIIFATALLSSAYPSWIASKLAVPSLERRWRLPTKPSGDTWHIPLPFVVTKEEIRGVLFFLKEFLDLNRTEYTGKFWCRETKMMETEDKHVLTTIVRLAPFDAGIEQEVSIIGSPLKGDVYSFAIKIRRIQGIESIWITSNYRFIDDLRKQFLIWRSLDRKDKEKYKYRDEKT
ncbi:MAG: FtsX-like permease family protein [Candidatus Bathyarchaeia archaeon]